MNGRNQFFMNVAITLAIGDYGIISEIYSEMVKPGGNWNGPIITFDIIVALIMLIATVWILKLAYPKAKDRRVYHDK